MKFELPQNSVFGMLLRAPWWVSFVAGLGVFSLVRLFLAVPFAVFAALPFVGIALHVAWKQLRRPGAKRIAKTLDKARALPWDDFRSALEEGFRREGYTAERTNSGADFVLTRERKVTLVACKRWKVARTGVEPLREFDASTSARDAHARLYVAGGEITANARAFAQARNIRLVGEEELTKLLAGRGWSA
jgi:restriction system protein